MMKGEFMVTWAEFLLVAERKSLQFIMFEYCIQPTGYSNEKTFGSEERQSEFLFRRKITFVFWHLSVTEIDSPGYESNFVTNTEDVIFFLITAGYRFLCKLDV